MRNEHLWHKNCDDFMSEKEENEKTTFCIVFFISIASLEQINAFGKLTMFIYQWQNRHYYLVNMIPKNLYSQTDKLCLLLVQCIFSANKYYFILLLIFFSHFPRTFSCSFNKFTIEILQWNYCLTNAKVDF